MTMMCRCHWGLAGKPSKSHHHQGRNRILLSESLVPLTVRICLTSPTCKSALFKSTSAFSHSSTVIMYITSISRRRRRRYLACAENALRLARASCNMRSQCRSSTSWDLLADTYKSPWVVQIVVKNIPNRCQYGLGLFTGFIGRIWR